MTNVTRDSRRLNSPSSEDLDIRFLPIDLRRQCRSLIESYHEVHGYASLPNILWKSRLGPFIEKQPELRQCLRKASTSRSAKKANEGFVQIATNILSLEILASSFAGWRTLYPSAGEMARATLTQNAREPHTPLMDFYLYPPKYLSTAAVATLVPPPNRHSVETTFYHAANPELTGEKKALDYVRAARETVARKGTHASEPTI